MTAEEFTTALKSKFPFKKQSKSFATVKTEKDKMLAYDDKVEITAINYWKITNETLGFNMDKILDLESGNELLFISGTKKKDGLYYLNHESSLITVEEVETDEDAEIWIEDYLDMDVEDFSKLTADKKVALFKKEVGILLVEQDFQTFFDKVKMVTREDFFKKR